MEEEEELSVDVSNIFKSIQAAVSLRKTRRCGTRKIHKRWLVEQSFIQCEELTQRGQEYLLVTADPASQSCMKIGSEKGRQFLDVNSELVINFFSYCFGAQIIEDLGDQNETINQTDIPGNIIDSLDTPIDIKIPTINQPIGTTIEEDKEQGSTNTNSSNDHTEVFPDLHLVTQTTGHKPSTGTVTHTDQPEQQLIISGLPKSQSDEELATSREQGEISLQKLEHSKKQISKKISCTEQLTESNLEDLLAHEKVHKDLDLASEESTLPQIVSESQTLGIDSKNEKIDDELAEIVDAIPAVNENSTDSETDNQADSTKAQPESGGLNDSTKVQSESSGLNDSAKVQSESGGLNDSTKVQSESGGLNDSTEAQPQSGDLNDSIIAQSEPGGLNDSTEAQGQHELIKQDKSFVAEKMVTRKGKQKAKSSISSMDCEKKSQTLKEATNLLDKKKEISNVKTTMQANNITKNTNLRAVTSETKLTKKIQSKNKNAMIIPEEKPVDKPSKPTCTVCKATFSRIHSLKGHMLIIHQLEVSMEELQREPAQTSIEQKKKVCHLLRRNKLRTLLLKTSHILVMTVK